MAVVAEKKMKKRKKEIKIRKKIKFRVKKEKRIHPEERKREHEYRREATKTPKFAKRAAIQIFADKIVDEFGNSRS